VWKNKLIFVETPDDNETSIALENYRRVGLLRMFGLICIGTDNIRLATMVEGPYCCLLLEERFPRVLISITITAELCSCLGMHVPATPSIVD
jgi:hypothetical protein